MPAITVQNKHGPRSPRRGGAGRRPRGGKALRAGEGGGRVAGRRGQQQRARGLGRRRMSLGASRARGDSGCLSTLVAVHTSIYIYMSGTCTENNRIGVLGIPGFMHFMPFITRSTSPLRVASRMIHRWRMAKSLGWRTRRPCDAVPRLPHAMAQNDAVHDNPHPGASADSFGW
jgi:hypothetical protein